jgi:hypothetical protein
MQISNVQNTNFGAIKISGNINDTKAMAKAEEILLKRNLTRKGGVDTIGFFANYVDTRKGSAMETNTIQYLREATKGALKIRSVSYAKMQKALSRFN